MMSNIFLFFLLLLGIVCGSCNKEENRAEKPRIKSQGLPEKWQFLKIPSQNISRIIRDDDEGLEFEVIGFNNMVIRKNIQKTLLSTGHQQYCSEFGDNVRGFTKDRKYFVVTFDNGEPPLIQVADNTALQSESKPDYRRCFIGFKDLKIKKVYESGGSTVKINELEK